MHLVSNISGNRKISRGLSEPERDGEAEAIIALVKKGFTRKQIEAKTGRSKSFIARIIVANVAQNKASKRRGEQDWEELAVAGSQKLGRALVAYLERRAA